MANYREAARLVAGAALVYGVVAACSAGGAGARATLAPDAGSASGAAGVQGAGGSAGAGSLDGALDALADAVSEPVPDAVAADGGGGAGNPGPTIITAQCVVKVPQTGGLPDAYYAVANFPGKSIADLYGVRAYQELTKDIAGAPPGFSRNSVLPIIQFGQAAVLCGYDQATVADVVFWLP